MATLNQRAIAICDALVNGTATTEQRQRVLAAFGSAEQFIRETRQYVLNRLEVHESQAPVSAARQQVVDGIKTDFTEAP